MTSARDEEFLRQALRLAARGLGRVSPNPPVGCVVVQAGRVIGQGTHPVYGGPHAEVVALTAAQAAGESTQGATAYVTLMPCNHYGKTPPCTEALIRAGVSRVVVALEDPHPVSGDGAAKLRAAGIDVEVGLCATESAELLRGFIKHLQTGLPFVSYKYAMTLDGKIATASGSSAWISSPESRRIVQHLRSEHDAILVGSGTVLADDPRLTVRADECDRVDAPQPVRVVVDGQLQTPPSARLLRERVGPVWILAGADTLTSADGQARQRALVDQGAEVLSGPTLLDEWGQPRLDLDAAMRTLAGRGVRTVLCEGGAGLAGALFDLDLIDAVEAFVAPILVGGSGPSPLAGRGVQEMTDARRLRQIASLPSGPDRWIRGRVQ